MTPLLRRSAISPPFAKGGWGDLYLYLYFYLTRKCRRICWQQGRLARAGPLWGDNPPRPLSIPPTPLLRKGGFFVAAGGGSVLGFGVFWRYASVSGGRWFDVGVMELGSVRLPGLASVMWGLGRFRSVRLPGLALGGRSLVALGGRAVLDWAVEGCAGRVAAARLLAGAGRKVRAPPGRVLGNAQDSSAARLPAGTESGTETYRPPRPGLRRRRVRVKSGGKSARRRRRRRRGQTPPGARPNRGTRSARLVPGLAA